MDGRGLGVCRKSRVPRKQRTCGCAAEFCEGHAIRLLAGSPVPFDIEIEIEIGIGIGIALAIGIEIESFGSFVRILVLQSSCSTVAVMVRFWDRSRFGFRFGPDRVQSGVHSVSEPTTEREIASGF